MPSQSKTSDQASLPAGGQGLTAGDYAAAALFAVAAFGVAVWYAGPATADDTFIYMRYLRNLLRGDGFVYNVGEQSYGTTSFLWPLLLYWPAKIFGNTVWLWKLASASLHLVRSGIVLIFMRRLGAPRGLSILLAAFALLDPLSFRWIGTGMENGLVVLAFTAMVWSFWEFGRQPENTSLAMLSGALAAITPFARPELALFSLGMILVFLWEHRGFRRGLVPYLITFTATGFLLLGISYLLTGFLVPQAGEAKAIFLEQKDPLYALKQDLRILLAGSPGALVLVVLLARPRDLIGKLGALTVLFLAVVFAYHAARNHLLSTRYASYISTPLLLMSAAVVAGRGVSANRAVLLSAVGLQSAAFLIVLYMLFPSMRVPEDEYIRKVAEDTRTLVPPDARVALSEIGVFGYYWDGYIVDLVGLVDPASVEWGEAQEVTKGREAIRRLVRERGATHYIEPFASEKTPVRNPASLKLLGEWTVLRNNASKGRQVEAHLWRLYEVQPQQKPGTSPEQASGR